MKKALMNASVASMIYRFNMENISILQNLGYQVDVACNFNQDKNPISSEQIEECKRQLKLRNCKIIETDCPRNILAVQDMVKTYHQLKYIADHEHYDLVHTQSPIGGVICRLAFRSARKQYGTRVIYQAHGFHFYDGAPIVNWMIYYPIERWCSKYTDTIITITQEDYKRAKKNFYCKDIQYVPGIGVESEKICNEKLSKEDKIELRKKMNIPEKCIWIISVGELNENKNQEVVIKAINKMDKSQKDSIFYTVVGEGKNREYLEKLITNLGLQENIKLLGFRENISILDQASDFFIIPSIREGLNVSLMEAMACGRPCIAGKIRGNSDLVDENGGELFNPNSIEECKKAIEKMLIQNCKDKKKVLQMGDYNKEKIRKFDRSITRKKMKEIYDR